MSEQLPGKYVRIEGVDGAGKSSLVEMAKQYNDEHGLDVVFTREPGGTPLGQEFREILLNDTRFDLGPEVEFLTYLADRRHLWDTVISPALEAGKTVASDRGIESVEYQIARKSITRDVAMGVSKLILPERYMQPDVLALISISKETRLARLALKHQLESPDKLEARSLEYFNEVHDRYIGMESLPYARTIQNEGDVNIAFDALKKIIFDRKAV